MNLGSPTACRTAKGVMPSSRASTGSGVAQARQINRQRTRRTMSMREFARRVRKGRIMAFLLPTALGFGGHWIGAAYTAERGLWVQLYA
jgi:hypothetical protein